MAPVHKSNWKRVAGFTVAALCALALLAVTFAALRAEAWVNDHADRLEKEWSAKLGRPVRIGEVEVSFFRGTVEVDGFEIGTSKAEPRAAPAAITLGRAELDVSMLRTLLSLGSRPRVQSILLHGLQLNVVRLPDGTLNWQQISDRLEAQPGARAEKPPEPVRKTVIDVARVVDGEIAFVDLARGAGREQAQREARISAIGLQIDGAGYERGMALALDAAALAQERNLRLRMRMGGVREREGRIEPPTVHALELRLARTELAPLAPFFAALSDDAGTALEQGALSADLVVDQDDENAMAKGNIALDHARFGRGERFDADLALDVAIDADADRANVKQAVLRAGEMSLSAQGVVSGLDDVLRLHDVRVRSEGLSFDRIRALYPALDRRADPAQLRGPFTITATGEGSRDAQHVELEANLTAASVVVPGRFHKPPATPLRLHAALDARADAVEISELALQLADFRVLARGHVRDLRGDAARFRMTFATPSPEVGSLLRLLPELTAAIGSGRKMPGRLVVTGSAEGTSTRYSAQAKLALSGLDARAKNARFHGGGQATFALRRTGERWSAETDADFTQLRAVYPGVIHKPDPTPLQFKAELSGVPGRPAAFEAQVPSFVFAVGRSDLRGSLRVANLDDPQITVQARARYLDLNDFVPGAAEQPASEREPVRGEEPSKLSRADGLISLRVDKGRASGFEYEGLEAKLRLENGRARAETLRVTAFGGKLSGSGSEFPLFAEGGPLRVRGELEAMQVQGLLERFADAPKLLSGTLAGKIDVTTAGATLEDLRETLSGRLSGKVDDAEFEPGSGYAALAERLKSLAAVPEVGDKIARASERVPEDWELEDLAGALRFEDGGVIVEEPLAMRTPQGTLSLDGRISLSDAGRLVGTWKVEPDAIEALVGTELDLKGPVPIELRIDGPLTKPRFAFGNVEPLVQQLVKSYGEEQLDRATQKGIEKALEQSGLEVGLPTGKEEEREESRGAKGEPKEKKKKKEERPEDKARREIEKKLPGLF